MIGERVWRVRKTHVTIDAQITDRDDGAEIRYSFDGNELLKQLWPTRQTALADAARRLRELQRAGWTTHW